MNSPAISVMIPTVGTSPYLSDTLGSLQKAWCSDIEVIILDNASHSPIRTDFLGFPITIHRAGHRISMAENWNRGLEFARGEWIHYLHDDDWIEPEIYRTFMNDLVRREEWKIWFCGYTDHYEHLDRIFRSNLPSGFITSGIDNAEYLFRRSLSRCVATIMHRGAVIEAGRFDVALKHIVDWDLFYRIALLSGAFYQPQILGNYRLRQMSMQGIDFIRRDYPALNEGRLLHDIQHIIFKYHDNNIMYRPLRSYIRVTLMSMMRYYIKRGMLRRCVDVLGVYLTWCTR